jgi:hypothetical protein
MVDSGKEYGVRRGGEEKEEGTGIKYKGEDVKKEENGGERAIPASIS